MVLAYSSLLPKGRNASSALQFRPKKSPFNVSISNGIGNIGGCNSLHIVNNDDDYFLCYKRHELVVLQRLVNDLASPVKSLDADSAGTYEFERLQLGGRSSESSVQQAHCIPINDSHQISSVSCKDTKVLLTLTDSSLLFGELQLYNRETFDPSFIIDSTLQFEPSSQLRQASYGPFDMANILINDGTRISFVSQRPDGSCLRLFDSSDQQPLLNYVSLPTIINSEWSCTDPNLFGMRSTSTFSICDKRTSGKFSFENHSKCRALDFPIKAASVDSGRAEIKWSPFIPYWTSIIDQSGISIFDLRYAKHSMLQFQQPLCNSIVWSNSHVELMLGSSADRVISLWNLQSSAAEADSITNLVPHRVAQKTGIKACGGEISHLLAGTSRLDTFYGISLMGKLVQIEIDKLFQKQSLVTVNPNSTNGKESYQNNGWWSTDNGETKNPHVEIERELYVRNFDKVYDALIELSNGMTCIEDDFKYLQDLTNRTFPSLPIPPDSWNIASGHEFDRQAIRKARRLVRQEIKSLSKVCPPGFDPKRYFNSNDGLVQTAVGFVRLKVLILGLLEKNDITTLASLQPKIIAAMSKNPKFLQPNLLQKLIVSMLEEDRKMALEFAKELMSKVFPARLDNNACTFVHLLLYPTIYDDDAVQALTIQAGLIETQIPKSPTTCISAKDNSANGYGQVSPIEHRISFSATSPLPIPNTSRSPSYPNSTPSSNLAWTGRAISQIEVLEKVKAMEERTHGAGLVEFRKCLRSLKHVLGLIDLEIGYEECLCQPDPKVLQDWLINKFYKKDTLTISAYPLLAYLHFTLHKGFLDEYFSLAGRLCHQSELADTCPHSGCTFGSLPSSPTKITFSHTASSSLASPAIPKLEQAILEFTKQNVFHRLQYALAQALETQRPSLLVKSIILIVRIVIEGIQPIPSFLQPFLIDRLRRLIRLVQFDQLIESGGSGIGLAIEELKMLLTNINRVKFINNDRKNELIREVVSLRSMLVSPAPSPKQQ